MISPAYTAGLFKLPAHVSAAFLEGYLETRADGASGPGDRDATVTSLIETGYTSGIDDLGHYQLKGSAIIGLFAADSRLFRFRLTPAELSYREINLRQDGLIAPVFRRDRNAPGKATKRKGKVCNVGLSCGISCISKVKTCRIKLNREQSTQVRDLQAQLAALQAQMAELEQQKAQQSAPKPGDVRNESLDSLNFDPNRFQYKMLPGETGSTGSLTGVKRWDPNLAGVVQVWQDPADGKTYIVNGHNRATLAKRLGVDEVTVRYLKAKNATEARAIGALTNIAEGRGNALDSAKFFRDSGLSRADLEAKGIPMKEKIATDGLALASLDDSLFRRVVDGRLPVGRAAVIGGSGLDHPQQRALSEMVEKREQRGGKITNDTLTELVDVVKASTQQQEFTLDLFGGSTSTRSLAFEKAEIQGGIRRRLSRERRLFNTVGKSRAASELERAGNRINVEQSANLAQQAQTGLRVFDQFKNSAGPISQTLNVAAERLANGENKRTVEREAYQEILNRIGSGDY